MKKFISLILCIVLAASVCLYPAADEVMTETEMESELEPIGWYPGEEWDLHEPSPSKNQSAPKEYTGLNDPELLRDAERDIYVNLTGQLDPSEYTVESVSTVYVSKEYLEELEYNSKSNIFFGYTLEELDEQFQDTKYVFTLGDDGETIVVPFEEYDDTFDRIIKNVAIGTGVILVCVTVSAVTGGVGAPAISYVFATSAKSAAIWGASSGVISGAISGTITGVKTGDYKKALKAAALSSSESYKWGAIAGGVAGGATGGFELHIASGGGLSLNEAAIILNDADVPAQFVKQIHSMDEYYRIVALAEEAGMTIKDFANICLLTNYPIEVVELFRSTEESVIYFEQAGLISETINGQAALVRTIDLAYESEIAGKVVTNLERMKMGYAAIDPVSGLPFELHHIGQSVNSPLAILTQIEHRGAENFAILHDTSIAGGEGVHSLISNSEWLLQKQEFWKAMAEVLA